MSTTAAPQPRRPPDVVPAAKPKFSLYFYLCLIQGLYYFVTGVWPLVSIETFQLVTGPKTDNWTGRVDDHWLVNTVAALVIAIGLALFTAAWRRRPAAEVVVLAVGSAVGLAVIDCFYVSRQTIALIYLLDAFGEFVLIVAWTAFLVGALRARRSPPPGRNP